jgi:hypothetical protein
MNSVGPFLGGTLIQYQHLRSSPAATFELESGNYYVPLGLGIGHAGKIEEVGVNVFIEPQFTVLSHGPGQPLFQVLSGVNFQFKP